MCKHFLKCIKKHFAKKILSSLKTALGDKNSRLENGVTVSSFKVLTGFVETVNKLDKLNSQALSLNVERYAYQDGVKYWQASEDTYRTYDPSGRYITSSATYRSILRGSGEDRSTYTKTLKEAERTNYTIDEVTDGNLEQFTQKFLMIDSGVIIAGNEDMNVVWQTMETSGILFFDLKETNTMFRPNGQPKEIDRFDRDHK